MVVLVLLSEVPNLVPIFMKLDLKNMNIRHSPDTEYLSTIVYFHQYFLHEKYFV